MQKKINKKKKTHNKCCCKYCANMIPYDIYVNHGISGTSAFCLFLCSHVSEKSFCFEFEFKKEGK